MNRELTHFFAAMRPVLLGQSTAEEAEVRMGRSASGTHRVAFYRRLVRNNHHGFTNKIYSFLRSRVNAALWKDLVGRYLLAHPPSHWEPNRTAEAFPLFLEAELQNGGKIEPWWPELAQYEWAEFATYTAPDDPPEVTSTGWYTNPTLTARLFEYDVATWVRQGGASDPNSAPPGKRQHVLISYRDPATLLTRFAEATPWTLLVITSLEQGQDPIEAAKAHGAAPEATADVLRDLEKMGLIGSTL